MGCGRYYSAPVFYPMPYPHRHRHKHRHSGSSSTVDPGTTTPVTPSPPTAPPAPPGSSSAPPDRLLNPELDPETGHFEFDWMSSDGQAKHMEAELDDLIGLLNGRVDPSYPGFFTSTLKRDPQLATYAPTQLIYRAKTSIGDKRPRWYSFDLADLFYMDDQGNIYQKTPDMIKNSITSDSTQLLPSGQVPPGAAIAPGQPW